MKALVAVVLTAGVIYIVYRLIAYYKTAEGDWWWPRLLGTARHSATILTSFFVLIGSWTLTAIDYLAQVFGMTDVQQYVDKLPASMVGASWAVIAVLVIISRLRTLRRSA